MRRLYALALIAPLALAASACGSSSDSGSGAETTAPVTSETSGASTTTASGGAGSTELKVASSDLGDIVVDGEGRTLYLFTADTGTTTACTGTCATAWPALVAPVTTGSGVSGTVGEATQADGADQITLNGHLLYYYASDIAPGNTSGQGVGGNWFVVDGTGNAVTTAASGSPSGY